MFGNTVERGWNWNSISEEQRHSQGREGVIRFNYCHSLAHNFLALFLLPIVTKRGNFIPPLFIAYLFRYHANVVFPKGNKVSSISSWFRRRNVEKISFFRLYNRRLLRKSICLLEWNFVTIPGSGKKAVAQLSWNFHGNFFREGKTWDTYRKIWKVSFHWHCIVYVK